VVGAGLIGLSGDGHGLVLPLLATQILWINLITDSGPALAMGVDPETDDVMARQPRKPAERAIDARMWIGIVGVGLVMAIATLLTIDFYLPGGLIEGERDLANARTAGFTVLVFAQLFNCFNARSETTSALRRPFVNPWLWAAIGVSVLLQIAVVNIGVLNVAFGTVALDAAQWMVCVAAGGAVLAYSELRKAVLRAFAARTRNAATD
jgi:magnesium-transporting ATPase (P-type)